MKENKKTARGTSIDDRNKQIILETVEKKEQAENISFSLLTRLFLHCFYEFLPVNNSGVNIFIQRQSVGTMERNIANKSKIVHKSCRKYNKQKKNYFQPNL